LGSASIVIANAKYAHTNLVARDWRSLARFYQDVFGCVPVPPERDYSGPDLEAGTGVPGARLQGVHLLLPGHGPDGPTLEVFQYSEVAGPVEHGVNRPGFAHIAFSVASVRDAHAEVLAHGGARRRGGHPDHCHRRTGHLWCYVADPEGNILELQSWS
jgi:glyoxylase I family protein